MGLLGLLSRIAGRMTRKEPLSQVAGGMGYSMLPGKCAICGERFAYPSRTIFLPWKPDPSTVDVGGYCMGCDRAVCSLHVGLVEWKIEDKKGWSPSCAECGAPLMGVEVSLIHARKKAERSGSG